MLISTEINSAARLVGEEKAVELVAKAGFDAYDFSMFAMGLMDWKNNCMLHTDHPLQSKEYLAFARRIRRVAEDNGIHCNQSHAPFPIYCREIWDLQRRAIECTAEAGGKICVIHPDNFRSAQENAELYLQLLPFAKDHGVKIATENMWCWDKEKDQASFAACCDAKSFTEHMEVINDPYFVACLDIGHAEMRGLNTSAPELIHALGHHLQALHIHDNDCRHDSHALPYTMDIDFSAVAKALREADYQGYLTLECDQHCGKTGPEEVPQRLAEMVAAVRRLEAEILA